MRVSGFQVATRRLLFQPVPASCAASSDEKVHLSISDGSPLASNLSSLAFTSPFQSLASNWLLKLLLPATATCGNEVENDVVYDLILEAMSANALFRPASTGRAVRPRSNCPGAAGR